MKDSELRNSSQALLTDDEDSNTVSHPHHFDSQQYASNETEKRTERAGGVGHPKVLEIQTAMDQYEEVASKSGFLPALAVETSRAPAMGASFHSRPILEPAALPLSSPFPLSP